MFDHCYWFFLSCRISHFKPLRLTAHSGNWYSSLCQFSSYLLAACIYVSSLQFISLLSTCILKNFSLYHIKRNGVPRVCLLHPCFTFLIYIFGGVLLSIVWIINLFPTWIGLYSQGTVISHKPLSELRRRDKSGRRQKGRTTQT